MKKSGFYVNYKEADAILTNLETIDKTDWEEYIYKQIRKKLFKYNNFKKVFINSTVKTK